MLLSPWKTVTKLREEIGLSQIDFAKRVGLHRNTVYRLEKGDLELSRRVAIRISEKTGVSVDWLLQNDATQRIDNVFGERWSGKDRRTFESHSKRWPAIPPEIRRWHLAVCVELLQDYLALRSLIAGLPNHIAAIKAWRACQDRAIIHYLNSYPPARDRAKKMPRWDEGLEDRQGPELPESVNLLYSLRQRFSREGLQTVKDDIDAILDNFDTPYNEDEVARVVGFCLSHGFRTLEEVLKILDGMTDENKKAKLLELLDAKNVAF